jgi:hypothetical protein
MPRAAPRRILFASMLVVATVVACNAVLGIDEQGMRAEAVDGGTEAGDAADSSTRPAFEACSRDIDCVAPNGCYTPHCDPVLGACTYGLCEAAGKTCSKGTCNMATGACSDPLPYGFLATSYDVPGVTSGCGPKPETCVAAAFPYVFIGTRNDLVALRTDDLTAKAPTNVPVIGVGTAPQQVIASGRRIWVLGAVLGEKPPYQLSISSIDVPSDPTVKELRAHTVVVTYPFATAVGFAAPSGGLFLSSNDPVQGLPTALIAAPLADDSSVGVGNAVGPGGYDASAPTTPGTVSMIRVGNVPAGAIIVAASGARLVLYRAPSIFNLVTGAGTTTATTAADVGLNPGIAPIGKTMFAQGPDGAVMMTAPITTDGPLPDCNCSSHARLQYVFPNAVSTSTDVNQVLDPEAFTNPQAAGGLCHQCTGDYVRPVTLATWLDRRSVLTASPFSGAPANRVLTDVRLLARDPLEGNPKRRFQTKPTDTPKGDFALDRIALASAAGIGYLVLADGQGNDVSLSIVDPRCDLAGQ